MNSREIAEQAGFAFGDIYWTERDLTPLLERFAELVAAHESEECAKLCDRFANRMMTAEECADAIRARGKA